MNGDIVIKLFTDSQYVMGQPARENILKADNFITQKENELQNPGLLKLLSGFYQLHHLFE